MDQNMIAELPPNVKRKVIETLWRRGIVNWKLDSCQRKLYETFKTSRQRITVFSASRRLGKTTTLLTVALEYALQNKDVQIKYGAPTAKMVKKMIQPTLKMLMADCPKDLMPKFDRAEGVYIFKNGSKLFIEGLSDGNAENLRGTAMDLGIVDEGGFVGDLKYIVNSILLPQALTTKGRIIIASTPPTSPDHEFVDFMLQAQLQGSFIQKTIYDFLEDVKNDPPEKRNRITPEEVEEIKQASGGEDSTDFQREYLCRILVDQAVAIIPEFTPAKKREIVVPSNLLVRPAFYDCYVSMDLGWNDFHGILFAYYDFKRRMLVIEDEILVRGRNINTQKLAYLIKEKEKQLWTNEFDETKKPYLRVSDNEMLTVQDLNTQHGLDFVPTDKNNKNAAVNQTRIAIASNNVEISDNCKNLIIQLESGIWATDRMGITKDTFKRSKETGHFDLIDALVYLIRNVDWNHNPYPSNYGFEGMYMSPKREEPVSESASAFKRIFRRKQ